MGFWVLLAAFIVMIICGYYAYKKRSTNKWLARISAIVAIAALIMVIYLV